MIGTSPADGSHEGGRARPAKPAGVWIPLPPVAGIPVYVDVLVLGLFALLFLGHGGPEAFGPKLLLVGIALASVLVHELGHAWMARRRGLRVGGIFLHLVPFAYVERGRPADELRVAVAGPAVNLAVAAMLYACPVVRAGFPWLDLGAWLHDPLWTAFGINLLMGVVNLVPALPADGGRALRAGLMLVVAPATAYSRTATVGTFVGTGLFLVAVWLWPSSDAVALAVLGVFFIMVAWREARAGQLERRRARTRGRGADGGAAGA